MLDRWTDNVVISGLFILMVIAFAVWRFTTVVKLSRRLRASEGLISGILNSAAEGICGFDLDGICIFANPACARMLGYERGRSKPVARRPRAGD